MFDAHSAFLEGAREAGGTKTCTGAIAKQKTAVPQGAASQLGPKITNGIRSSQRQRDQVINFVVAGLVLRDSVFGVRPSFKPCWLRFPRLAVKDYAWLPLP